MNSPQNLHLDPVLNLDLMLYLQQYLEVLGQSKLGCVLSGTVFPVAITNLEEVADLLQCCVVALNLSVSLS